MKNYDDLQRFKEKTQTQDINFRDMSGQSLENDQQRWAIIQQLSEEKNHDDVLETGQRIDRAQPQPVKSDAFTAPVVAQLLSARTVSTGSLLLDSVAASPKPVTPLPSLRAQAAVQTTPATVAAAADFSHRGAFAARCTCAGGSASTRCGTAACWHADAAACCAWPFWGIIPYASR